MQKLIPIIFVFFACQEEPKPLTAYVNPFIGTGGHGHTYPGASAPFGMVQLSPDSRLEGWDGCVVIIIQILLFMVFRIHT